MWWNSGMGYGMGWAGWLLMAVVMIAFWALVVVGIFALFRTMRADRGQRYHHSSARDALQILDERFARGEIDVEEYRERRNQLRAHT